MENKNEKRGGWNKGLPKEQQPKFGKKTSKETKIKISHSEKGKILSKETKEKISKSYILTEKRLKNITELGKKHKGKNHWNWIEDRTKLRKQKRNDDAYKEWRLNVWKRDNFKCKIDNENCKGKIIAHHILDWKHYLEERYNINNGITLCQAHHPRGRAEEKRLVPFLQGLVLVSK